MEQLHKIDKSAWDCLQNALVQSVIAGGTASMKYYRKPPVNIIEKDSENVSKNPSTTADLHATLAILYALDHYLTPITSSLFACDYACLAEETHYVKWFQQQLPVKVFQKIEPATNFFSIKKGIRVIIDGIDGTGNFLRGIPLFCSAAALLIDNHLRVSAIYDPVHHVVYSAVLPGPENDICQGAEAWEWHIANNHRIDLIHLNQKLEKKPFIHEAIGVHLTRSHPDKLREFIQPNNAPSVLEKLSHASAGIYTFNSSFVAMIYVAQGALGAYINNTTHLWDVAAGEVLVRACGGDVTDFHKKAIHYNTPLRVSVVAAKKHIYEMLYRCL
jgi:fructose-1,6-bisphosphatase/inositol monophosphatase family enzyme